MIFPTKEVRDEAETQMDNQQCVKETMVVDRTKMLVPVQVYELEDTRDSHSLAVHGIPAGTREEDIRAVFIRADQVTIAKRGGSAFLNYASREQCEEDFLALEDVVIRGASVVVMFGHHRQMNCGQVDKSNDLREKLEISRNRDSWAHVLDVISEMKRKGKKVEEDEDSFSSALMGELLLSSGLRLDRMRKQFRRSKGREEMMDIKLRWLDRLVASVCQNSDLPESEVSVLNRGEMRQLVEEIWLFLDTYRDTDSEDEEEEIPRDGKKDRMARRSLSTQRDISDSKRRNRSLIRRDRSRSLGRGREVKNRHDKTSQRRNSRDRSRTRRSYRSSSHQRRSSDRSRSRSSTAHAKRGRSWDRSRSRSSTVHAKRRRRRSEWERRQNREKNDRRESSRSESCRSVSRSRSSVSQSSSSSRQVMVVDNRQVDRKVSDLELDLENNNSTLAGYLEQKLSALGLKTEQVSLEVTKITVIIRQVVDLGKVSLLHSQLVDLLTKFRYHSSHFSVRLAAGMVVEWWEKEGRETDETLPIERREMDRQEAEENGSENQVIPSEIMGVDEGYPRMALVMAFYLHTVRGLEEQVSKDLARSMVGVWITYGFTYQQMKEVCLVVGQQEEVLRNMLNNKLSEGFVKPKSFGFSKLIKLTLFYFTHAVC